MSIAFRPTREVAMTATMALAVGALTTWAVVRNVADQEIQSVSLAHGLEVTGLCANALTMIESGDDRKLSLLLRQGLEDALQRSNRLVDNGASLGFAAPNLTDSVRRAAAYYGRLDDAGRKGNAEHLLEHLTEAK